MVPARRLPPDLEEFAALVFSFVEQARAHIDAGVAEFDLSGPQARVLRYLAARGPVPMRELAHTLGCDASNITGIVDRLEARGLVERRPAPTDRRVKSLVLTADGRDVAVRMWQALLERARLLWTVEDAEQEVLVRVLRRLHERAGDGAFGCWCPTRPAGA